MIGLCMLLVGQAPLGEYANGEKDVRLVLPGGGNYTLEIGSPLSVPKDRRHVTFQNGKCDQVKGRLKCSPNYTFHSPDRRNSAAYIGVVWGRESEGYQQIYKTKALQEKFRAELKWREKTGGSPFFIAEKKIGTRFDLVYQGTILQRVPAKRYN